MLKILESSVPKSLDSPNTYRAIYQDKVTNKMNKSQNYSDIFQSPYNKSLTHSYETYLQFDPFKSPFKVKIDPLDPNYGGLILPQHQPGRISGEPKIYPTRPWPDPFAQPDEFIDPDMPQGLRQNPNRMDIGPFFPRHSKNNKQPPFNFY